MSIANSFPVFEADQVLTNKHLNDLFNYLDQQDRITRCKLLGSGIVCGLDISYSPGVIGISKGCGLTSQGFLILFCDHIGQNGYKYYIPYTRPAFPNDLKLIIQCGPEPDHNNIPFFSLPATGENFDNGIFLLLTQDDYNALTDNSSAVSLSQADLGEYAVVLFLEADELSLKNCDTNDCNDKGSLMDFEIRPLLVNKKTLGASGSNGNVGKLFQNVELRRYNVPVKNLNTADDVLNAFVALLDDQTLSQLSDDLMLTYDQYGFLLTGNTTATNPFGQLADFKKDIQAILQIRPFLIQYYYDFIYDLILALTEFRRRSYSIVGECCGDEMKFPFHLMLGEADQDTVSNGLSAYRQYFIYSPLFDVEGGKSGELRSLLMRLILIYQDFLLSVRTSSKENYSLPEKIKITPSNYSHASLSKRCIPYYYKVVHDNTDVFPQDLYYYWDYDKTKRGDARMNLCYDPTPYNTANTIVNPLYYDIERYNFFRVEGHIGKNINTALSSVVSIKQNMNLPFDVVALSADYIGALIAGSDPVCCIQDLESDYRILIAGFICALHDIFCYAGKPAFQVPGRALSGADLFGSAATLTTKASSKKTTADAAKAEDTDVLSLDAVGLITDHPFISGLVNEYQSTGVYVKGDTLSRLCAPAVNTIGNYYISSVKATSGKFTNPVSSTATGVTNVLNYHLFEFLDSVESMFAVLMKQDLSLLDTNGFKTLYSKFVKEVNFIGTTKLGTLVNFQSILQTCIVEKLEALKNEYLRRMAQYRLARNFNYYFKKHPGIEHKAGVPRGGTFILVYHEERKNRFVDLRSLFVNKELSQVLLSNFRELLNPDVNLATQEAKTKMLAVSLLYKDPDLYMRFRDVMQQYLDDCKDLPPDTKTTITGIINQPPSKQTYPLEDGMVIADFYVPYICCSDCPPIAYILPAAAPTENPPLQKTLSVCGDLKEYPLEPDLKATDTVNIISNADGLKLKDQLVALPSSSTSLTKAFHLSYQVNDQQTDLTLTRGGSGCRVHHQLYADPGEQ